MRQLALDIGLSTRPTLDSFFSGPNEAAINHLRLWTSGGTRAPVPTYLWGDAGSGKTHLLQAICGRILDNNPGTELYYISCEAFVTQFIDAVKAGEMNDFRHRFRDVDVLVIDDIHYLTKLDQSQDEFFHTFNALRDDLETKRNSQAQDSARLAKARDEAAAAKKENKPPQQFCDEVSALFQGAWKTCGIQYDRFYRSTQKSHYALVANALQQLKDKGDIYFGSYEGKYCVGCERFRTDKEWNEQGLCPDHLTPPDFRKESNYFFKMSAYQERLIAHYRKHPDAIQPAHFMKDDQMAKNFTEIKTMSV